MLLRALGSSTHTRHHEQGADTCFPVGSRLPPCQRLAPDLHNGWDHEARQVANGINSNQQCQTRPLPHTSFQAAYAWALVSLKGVSRHRHRVGAARAETCSTSRPRRVCDNNGSARDRGTNNAGKRDAISTPRGVHTGAHIGARIEDHGRARPMARHANPCGTGPATLPPVRGTPRRERSARQGCRCSEHPPKRRSGV